MPRSIMATGRLIVGNFNEGFKLHVIVKISFYKQPVFTILISTKQLVRLQCEIGKRKYDGNVWIRCASCFLFAGGVVSGWPGGVV